MGVQLIIVVETNKKNQSDWMYIKATIEHFYNYDNAEIKFSPVYMDSKTKYKDKEAEIRTLISKYAKSAKGNKSEVIYCFDSDDYDKDPTERDFLIEAQRYCNSKDYQFVWFCKDIERVFGGKKVEKNKKRDEAIKFLRKNGIRNIEAGKLSVSKYRNDSSNILLVLDKYLKRN